MGGLYSGGLYSEVYGIPITFMQALNLSTSHQCRLQEPSFTQDIPYISRKTCIKDAQ